MISFTVRMSFRSEDREEIRSLLQELTTASRQEPGCVAYVPHTDETDPNIGVIYEQYRDEAAAEAHRATSHFDRLATNGLYPRMLERSVEMLEALL